VFQGPHRLQVEGLLVRLEPGWQVEGLLVYLGLHQQVPGQQQVGRD